MCKIRQSWNRFLSADPQMDLQPRGSGASWELLKSGAAAGASLVVRTAVQVVWEQEEGKMWRSGVMPSMSQDIA